MIAGTIFEPTSQKRGPLLVTCCACPDLPGSLMVTRGAHLVNQVQKALQHGLPGVIKVPYLISV